MSPGRIPVIYNGVDASRFHPGTNEEARRAIGVAPGRLLIGAVGNVRRIKGYEVLVDAAGRLIRDGLDVEFAIVGKGNNDFQAELVQQAKAAGVGDRIHFLGFRNDVPELYRAFDIYALTSHSEGFPLSTIQALASGLPVLATRCGGPEEMVEDGVDGLLVERGSGTAVADGLARLTSDASLRRRIGVLARNKAVTRFSTPTMISEYETLYASLVPAPASALTPPRPSSVGAAP